MRPCRRDKAICQRAVASARSGPQGFRRVALSVQRRVSGDPHDARAAELREAVVQEPAATRKAMGQLRTPRGQIVLRFKCRVHLARNRDSWAREDGCRMRSSRMTSLTSSTRAVDTEMPAHRADSDGRAMAAVGCGMQEKHVGARFSDLSVSPSAWHRWRLERTARPCATARARPALTCAGGQFQVC